MKRIWAVLAVMIFLGGCSGNQEIEEALDIRSHLLSASEVTFHCQVSADYIDTLEVFTLDCSAGSDGTVEFTVAEPESIRGITGTVSAEEGALTFDDTVLAFPLMADDRLSPVSAPWLLLNTLKHGYITSSGEEGELLHLTIDDSYADDALTLEVWCGGDGIPIAAEIGWQGRRVVSMTVESWNAEA